MDSLTKLWSWIKTLPLWLRAIVLFLVAVLAFIFSMSFSACGTPKTVATVQNVNPNSTVTVTLSVSNETSSSVNTDATPSINLQNPVNNGSNSH